MARHPAPDYGAETADLQGKAAAIGRRGSQGIIIETDTHRLRGRVEAAVDAHLSKGIKPAAELGVDIDRRDMARDVDRVLGTQPGAGLREEIHRAARINTALLAGRGLGGIRPKNENAEYQQVTRSPDDIIIVVGGGKGGHSAVILPWALHSDAVYEAVRLPDGNYAKNIADFRQPQHP